ncbi:MAG: nucleotide sugar dehydrogenase, partial [Gaiellaceae bacterium]
MSIEARFERREGTVAVVGLGRVGLPLAIAFARAGLQVRGLEADQGRRTAVELGKMPFLEPDTDQVLGEVVRSGRLVVSDDPSEVIPEADAIVLSVGTPLASDLRPDYAQLRSALDRLAPHLRPGQLLVQRSTVSPGTLEKIVRPFLAARIPDVAPELLLAACPERIAEGKAMRELESLPEIVGGIDDRSSAAASSLFRVLGPAKTIHVTDPTSAELAKLFTNVYRYVNFALANEFAMLAENYGADAHRVIGMVNDRYPRADVPRPGP